MHDLLRYIAQALNPGCGVWIGGREAVEQGVHAGAAIGHHLAHQEVDRLNLVGAFVNHGHAGVAHDLLNAPFAHIAVAAKDLQAVAATVKGLVREDRFHDRRDQRAPTLGRSLRVGIGAVLDQVEFERGAVGQHAAGIDPGALRVQNPAHRRVFGNEVRFAG